MKRIICISAMIIAMFSVCVSAENKAPARELSALEAMGISSLEEVQGGYIMNIDKKEAMTMSGEQIIKFYNAMSATTLTRRLVKHPFRGICFVLITDSGEKCYFLNSGVQYGKFGDDNYLCYNTSETNIALNELYIKFMSYPDKNYHENVPKNNTDYFIYPEMQWALKEVAYSASLSLLPYEVAETFGSLMNREQLCILLANFLTVYGNYADLNGFFKDRGLTYNTNYFDDTAGCDNSINMLHALGIVNGVSETSFRPGDPVNREQLAVMIKKTADVIGLYGNQTLVSSPLDSNMISPWATDAIHFVLSNNIMSATDGEFGAASYINAEQAVTCINRLYKLSRK